MQLEVLIDDYMFPAYVSPKIHSQTVKSSDIGEAFIRELEFSKLTLRLVNKDDPKDSSEEHTVAKLTGDTLPTLQRILYNPTELVLRSKEGEVSKITVSARYIPVQMKLDPKESINNMGTLRVDVLDAADLPSADRNGFSDPYCKFRIGDDHKDVFKTKVQKKTLHPAWNEFFEIDIKSRIGANFHVDVYDWDFGDSADWLGAAPIELESLEPFQAQEVTLPLNGKSGVIRLKLLFKPTYVIRSRQGSTTFAGTFAMPGKVIGAPVKGVGFVGGNVVRGASFVKHGLMSRLHKSKDSEDAASLAEEPDHEESPRIGGGGLSPSAALVGSPSGSVTPTKEHSRTRSTASQYGDRLSVLGGVGGRGDAGTAQVTIVSASNFPPSANLRVVVSRVLPGKSPKDIHKTKAHKGSGEVHFEETFKISNITADVQYQLRVVNHSTFGSDETLGEAMYLIDDQGTSAGQDKVVSVGSGAVTVRSNFMASDSSLRPTTSHSTAGGNGDESPDSPNSHKPSRRSFLSKRSVSGV